MAEHLPYYGHEQGCYNSKIPWGPEPCSGCVSLRQAEARGIQKALIAWKEAEPLHDAEVRADALDAARDAVDAVWSAPDGLLRGLCNHAEALAAIDALQTSLSGPAAVRTSEPEPPTSVAPAGVNAINEEES